MSKLYIVNEDRGFDDITPSGGGGSVCLGKGLIKDPSGCIAADMNTLDAMIAEKLSDESSYINTMVETVVKRTIEVIPSGDPEFGVARLRTGGGAGLFTHVDKTGEPISLDSYYFNRHPIYSLIQPALIDGQAMIRIPKFYMKYETLGSDATLANAKVAYFSHVPKDGYHLHPAFYLNNQEINQYWLAVYKGSLSADNTKLESKPGVAPAVSRSHSQFQQLCAARNVGDVTGFMMADVYQKGALKHLFLGEHASPDSQLLYGNGHVSGSGSVTVDNPQYNPRPWRGFWGLWGNVAEMIDGIRTNASRQLEIWDGKGMHQYINTTLVPAQSGSSWKFFDDIFDDVDTAGYGYDMRDVFMPKSGTTDTQTNATYGDGIYGYNANCVVYEAGHWNIGLHAGLWSVECGHAASNSGAHLGCRLAKV